MAFCGVSQTESAKFLVTTIDLLATLAVELLKRRIAAQNSEGNMEIDKSQAVQHCFYPKMNLSTSAVPPAAPGP